MRGIRKRRLGLLATAVLAIAILGAACGGDPAPPPERNCPGGPPDAITFAILNQVNAARNYAAMGGLWWNPTLACNARDHANWMASTGNFQHQNLGGLIRDPLYSNFASLGENILVGPGSMSGNDIEASWMASPGHYANIMGWFDAVGIAVARGGDGRLWAVQEFGRHF